MPVLPRHSFEQTVQALEAAGGVVHHAARILGLHRHALEKRIAKDPRLQEKLEDIKNRVLDVAETNVLKGIEQGDAEYTRWFLARRGQSRGYVKTKQLPAITVAFPFSVIERVTVAPNPKLMQVTGWDAAGADSADAESRSEAGPAQHSPCDLHGHADGLKVPSQRVGVSEPTTPVSGSQQLEPFREQGPPLRIEAPAPRYEAKPLSYAEKLKRAMGG